MMTAWPACTALLPHAQAALDPASDGMFQIAESLGHSGSYVAARDLLMRIAEARQDSQDYGPDHPGTLDARARHAWSIGAAGDGPAARDQLAALLPEWERLSGPGHPDTLDARAALARWTGEAGDPAAARDQFAALLPDCERILGADHLRTLSARASLARWTGEAGDAAAARDQLAALLPDWDRLSGPGHPDTLAARDIVARWTGEAGDAASARDQFAALVGDWERLSGPDHPTVPAPWGDRNAPAPSPRPLDRGGRGRRLSPRPVRGPGTRLGAGIRPRPPRHPERPRRPRPLDRAGEGC